jgi:hypothetical protein
MASDGMMYIPSFVKIGSGIQPIRIKVYFFFIASGVGLSPLYCGHFWPIVPNNIKVNTSIV